MYHLPQSGITALLKPRVRVQTDTAASRRSQPHAELAKPTALSKLVSDREVLIRHVANWRFAVVTLVVQVFNVAVDVLLTPKMCSSRR